MVEVLELKPLKNKHLKLIFIESEFLIDWWFDASVQDKHDLVWNLYLITDEYISMLKDLIQQYKPDFVVEEKGSRWEDTLSRNDPLNSLFISENIPYSTVDISENAEFYLSASLDEHRNLIKELSKKIDELITEKGKDIREDFNFQKLVAWKKYLKSEYTAQENEIRYEVREAWMMMKLLKIAKKIEKQSIKAFFVCDARHFDGFQKLCDTLGVETEQIKVKRRPILSNDSNDQNIDSLIGKSILELTPIKVKKKQTDDKICYFFDTDDNASPFDINMAYDAGFDIVVPISNMTAEKVPKLVQDAIFSRKPKAPTTFFIGGSNMNEGEKIAKKVIESIVPPFECPVIIDPRGSHTTAASVVAKTIEVANKHGIENLKDKKVAVLGAGPVARIVSIIAAQIKCKTFIIETWNQSSEKTIKELAKRLNEQAGEDASEIIGIYAPNDNSKLEILKDKDIIWSIAAAGVEILSEKLLLNLPPDKIIVDINLVPPYGIRGLKPKDDNKEIYPGIFGVGALSLGRIKSNTEANILKEASNTKGKRIFDFTYAFETAKNILFGTEIKITK